jgi:hypothetical protein
MLALVSGAALQAQQAVPAASDEDVLIFNNGDQLSGTLQRSVNGSVVFKSDMAGEITVPLSKIKELRTHGSFAVLQHGVPVAQSRQTVPAPVVITTETVTVNQQVVPAANVAYIVDAKTFQTDLAHTAAPWAGWTGAVNLGTSFTQATIHGGTITGGIALSRQVPVVPFFRARNRTTLNFQENYGVLTTPGFVGGTPGDVQAKTSIMHADAERDEYFTRTAYVLANAAFDHNYAQSIDLQQIYGGGFGWTVFNSALHQLDLKGDVHYERQQHFDRRLDQNLIGSTFSEAYRRSLPLKMSLTQTASIAPAWNNLNAYSANGSIVLAAPLFRRLSLNLTTTDSFINNPDPNYQKNSLTVTTGLTYTLK